MRRGIGPTLGSGGGNKHLFHVYRVGDKLEQVKQQMVNEETRTSTIDSVA